MQVRGAKNIIAFQYSGIEDADYLLADQATSATVVTEVLPPYLNSFDPMVGRLTILPGGTTADVPAGDIDIEGTDLLGAVQTEAIALLANASTRKEGVKVWKSVTKITFPVQDGAAATYDVGLSSDLDIVIAGKPKRLLEVLVGLASASATSETFSGVAEFVADGNLDFQVHSEDMNTKQFSRQTVNFDQLEGVQFHWVWANTNAETFGFQAIFELK